MVRQKRQESAVKRSCHFIFYRLLRMLATIDIPLDSGDFSLIDRRVADRLTSLPERGRFVRGLRSWLGYRQAALPYDRPARLAGEPKYTYGKLLRLAMDGIVSFSGFPLRVAAYLGLMTSCAGMGYLAYALLVALITKRAG